jgi:hypothetical protein
MRKRNKNTQSDVIQKGITKTKEALMKHGWVLGEKLHRTKNTFSIINQRTSSERKLRLRTLSKKNPVPMGRSLMNYDEDFLIVCRNLGETTEFFVIPMRLALERTTRKTKNGKDSYWFEKPDYIEYLDNWNALR